MDQATISGVVDATALVANRRARNGTDAVKRAAANDLAAVEKKTKCDDYFAKSASNLPGNDNA
jgi:hydroxymethylglutaryl-CoA reductase